MFSVDSFSQSEIHSTPLRKLAAMLQHSAPAGLREKLKNWMPPRPTAPPIPISAEERARLDGIIKDRTEAYLKADPDLEGGNRVFETHCIVCHQRSGKGALIGPQLDGIGTRGVQRLCEDIIDPNRNVDAHFYLTAITMKDGTSAGGFLKKDEGTTVTLVDATGKGHRIPRRQIAERKTTSASLMPPIFSQSIQEKDFLDLIGW